MPRLRRKQGEGLDVAVVEDDPDLGRMLEVQLSTLGHRPTIYSSDFEKLAAEGFPGGDCPDAVLVDLLLGSRVDGIDVARRIRALCSATVVVIASAVPIVFRRELDRLLDEGIVDAVLTKPVAMKDLDAAVRAARKEN